MRQPFLSRWRSRRAMLLFYNRSLESWMLRGTLCEESTPGSTYLLLNRGGGVTSGKMRRFVRIRAFRSVCHKVCIKTKRWRKETWVHYLTCLYLLRYVKPDASIIQSTARVFRRFPGRATFFCMEYAYVW